MIAAKQQPGNVWLIGMMGAGKSTVARLLAERTGRHFVDMDKRLEERAGCTVSEIFARHGEPHFRALEAALTVELADAAEQAVIATGGGAPCEGDSMARMQASGLVVWLRADHDDILARADLTRRPLLADAPDPRAVLLALEERRRAVYRRADLVVERARRESAQVADELAAWLEHYGAAPLGRGGSDGAIELEVALGDGSYPIVIDPGARSEERFAARLARLAPPGRAPIALITDENIARLHAPRYLAALQQRGFRTLLSMERAGEQSKRLATVEAIAESLVQGGIERRSTVIALGGGVIGDLAGLVASLLLRGLAVVQVPTTLLAEVDSSVGGKTGVNLPSGKNLVGSFHQPRLVWADTTTLGTLDPRDLAAGLAELAKHALLDGGALLDRLEAEAERARAGDPALVAELVAASCAIKARVVADDERELRDDGGRALLNYGHTVGHALETASLATADPLRHGEAVALGMIAATRVARAFGAADLEPRVSSLLARLGLPTDLDRRVDRQALAAVAVDKKRRGRDIRYVILDRPGAPRVVPVEPGALAGLLGI